MQTALKLASTVSAQARITPVRANQIILFYKAGATTSARAGTPRSRLTRITTLARATRTAGAVDLMKLPTGMTWAQAVAQMANDTALQYAEPNFILTKFQARGSSNDAVYTAGNLWGMEGDDTSLFSGNLLNTFGSQAAEAWARYRTDCSNVWVGIIDEGFMFNHQDLINNVGTNPGEIPGNGRDDDGNGYVDDVYGWDFANNDNSVFDSNPGAESDMHGTHCAGTIGAQGGNGVGVAGVCWRIKMMSGKFLGASGGSTSDAIRAIDYFVDLKRRHSLNLVALSNSWGGGGYSAALFDAIERARAADILFIAAAGNEANNNDARASYPAAYPNANIVTVAAIDSSGGMADFSNFGATTVDIGAPGVGIQSTYPYCSGAASTSCYRALSGTSMATPHVSGAVALYKAHYPAATGPQIRAALLSSARPTDSLRGKCVTGGRLDVNTFLATAPGGAVAPSPPSPPPPFLPPFPPPVTGVFAGFVSTAGGSVLTGDDVMSPLVQLGASYSFLGGTYSSVYVSTNGYVNIGTDTASLSAMAPITSTSSAPRVAAYTTDLVVGAPSAGTCAPFGVSQASHRAFTTGSAAVDTLVRSAATSVPGASTFASSAYFVATWTAAAFYGVTPTCTTRSTLQVVLARSSAGATFLVLQYAQLAAPPATFAPVAGFYGATDFRALWPDGAFSAAADKLVFSSSSGSQGRWIYRVDGATVNTAPTVAPPPSPPPVTSAPAPTPAPTTGPSNGLFGSFISASGGATLQGDDVPSDLVTLGWSMPYLGTSYPSARLCTNGYLGLGSAAIDCSGTIPSVGSTQLPRVLMFSSDLVAGPRPTGCPMGAPQVQSASFSSGSPQVDAMVRATALGSQLGFTSSAYYVVTFTNARYYVDNSDPTPCASTNTFQAVLTRSASGVSFVILQYAQLAVLTDAVGSAGLQSSTVVFNLSPTPTTTPMALLTTSSNVGVPGRWVYRVDGTTVVSALPPSSVTPAPATLPPTTNILVSFISTASRNAYTGDDAASAAFTLGYSFPFLGASYSAITVCTNGYVGLGTGSIGCGATMPGTLTLGSSVVGLYVVATDLVADGVTGCTGGPSAVSFNSYSSGSSAVDAMVRQSSLPGASSFTSANYFVVTFAAMTYYGSGVGTACTGRMNFQVVLAASPQATFVVFQYATVTPLLPTSTLRPVAGLVGVSDVLALLPDAAFPTGGGVSKLTVGSTLGVPGRWVYRVDGARINAGPQASPPPPAGSGGPPSTLPANFVDTSGGDVLLGDDVASGLVQLQWSFPYLGSSFSSLSICTNGYLALGTASPTCTYDQLPRPVDGRDTRPRIYVLGGDLNLDNSVSCASGNSAITFVTSPSRGSAVVDALVRGTTTPGAAGFTSTSFFAATWSSTLYYGGSTGCASRSTFQVVLAADSTGKGYAVLSYAQVGAPPASMVLVAGLQGSSAVSLWPSSPATNPASLASSPGNAGVAGSWVFQVDSGFQY